MSLSLGMNIEGEQAPVKSSGPKPSLDQIESIVKSHVLDPHYQWNLAANMYQHLFAVSSRGLYEDRMLYLESMIKSLKEKLTGIERIRLEESKVKPMFQGQTDLQDSLDRLKASTSALERRVWRSEETIQCLARENRDLDSENLRLGKRLRHLEEQAEKSSRQRDVVEKLYTRQTRISKRT